ncbi:hypothetical protein [Niallia sp. FSL M8-0099]|uniref:hypothetical protein n=1 Tax=Niallia sp. FSL M8-0099 TaxID=2954519 RepID=UPI0030FC70E7
MYDLIKDNNVQKIEKSLIDKAVKMCVEKNVGFYKLENDVFNGKVKPVITYICEKHGRLNTSLASFRVMKDCYMCKKEKKENRTRQKYLNEFKYLVEEKGGELLTFDYINAHTKLSVKCKDGHVFEINLNNLKSGGNWCGLCSRKKYSIEDLKEYAKTEHNGLCLSEKYEGNQYLMRWKCEHGHMFEMNFYKVKNFHQWCPICRKNQFKISLEYLNTFILANKSELLEINDNPDFISDSTTVVYKCKNGHINTKTMNAIFYKDSYWCNSCYLDEIRIKEYNSLVKLAKSRDYRLLTTADEFKNQKTRLRFICKNNHYWECNTNNFKKDRNCKECNLEKN